MTWSPAARSATSGTQTAPAGRSPRRNSWPAPPAGRRFISTQNHYNLLDRRAELEVTPAAEAYGLGVLPYFPLANGLLTGKYSPDTAPAGSRLSHTRTHMVHDADWDQLQRFSAFAEERGLSEIQVAFSWLAAQPSVSSVIAGATRPEQIRQNAEAVRLGAHAGRAGRTGRDLPHGPQSRTLLGRPADDQAPAGR